MYRLPDSNRHSPFGLLGLKPSVASCFTKAAYFHIGSKKTAIIAVITNAGIHHTK
jgi:hypothetical protein